MDKKVTIRDVAKYAEVSPATVSYVLNGVNKVSDETRVRVMQAMKELNYSPNFTAISLSKRTSNLIGIMYPIVNDMESAILKGDLYYNDMISGIEKVARNNSFDVLITGIGKIEECTNWVKKRNIDGLIFLGLFPEELYKELRDLDVPIVLVDTYEKYTSLFHRVNINDEYGGYIATKHLIELGHEHIAFVSPDINYSAVSARRLAGYKRALTEAGIRTNKELYFQAENSFASGNEVGERILASKLPITAIFAISDVLVIGMLKGLQLQGKCVPEDYSVVGFDDLSISNYISPALTTVKQDIFQKGTYAAELLIDNIEKAVVETKKMELSVELIIRESTKRVKN